MRVPFLLLLSSVFNVKDFDQPSQREMMSSHYCVLLLMLFWFFLFVVPFLFTYGVDVPPSEIHIANNVR